ncbi:MAG: MDR family oxidoreductase [Sphingomonadales bacterium]
MAMMRALLSRLGDDKQVTSEVVEMDEAALPEGDVTVDVEYTTVNYKDGMILTTGGGLVKTWPHVGGIDLAGTVAASEDARFKPGDRVTLNGYRLGELFWGGYATRARVKADHLVKLPDSISIRHAAAIGTAGYTSMLCVLALERHGIRPDMGEILVTGAAGGVGSVAVAILDKLGYTVTASTGRLSETDYLKALGATNVIERKEISEAPDRPLLPERFAGIVDTVAGPTIGHALSMLKYAGAAAVCGLAGGVTLPASILPFLLRGIAVYGIDSVMLPMAPRQEAWRRLGTDLPLDRLESTTFEARLEDVPALAQKILKGEVRGRAVVSVSA